MPGSVQHFHLTSSSGSTRSDKAPRTVLAQPMVPENPPTSAFPLDRVKDPFVASRSSEPADGPVLAASGEQAAHVVGTGPDVDHRTFAGGLLGQDGVLFQHVPALVVVLPQRGQDGLDIDVAGP